MIQILEHVSVNEISACQKSWNLDTGLMQFEYRARRCRSLSDWCIGIGEFYWSIEIVFSVTCICKQPHLYVRANNDKRVFAIQ